MAVHTGIFFNPLGKLARLGSLAILLTLSGCGGGGADTTVNPNPAPNPTPSPTVTPTATEQAQAAAAQVTATVLTDSAKVRLSWSDTVKTATAYRVERQRATTWESVHTTAATGNGQILQADTAAQQGSYRVVAVLPATTVLLRTSAGADSVLVQTGSTTPTGSGEPLDTAWLSTVRIQLGTDDMQAEPVNGLVPLSLATPPGWNPVSVRWFANLQALGAAGPATTGHATTWHTQGLVDGTHLLMARVEVQPNSFVEWRRTVQVKAPAVAASLSVSGTQGMVTAQVSASSANGIASVHTTLSGPAAGALLPSTIDLGILTQPNGCSGRGCTTPNAYVFPIDTRILPRGSYTVTSTITDALGERLMLTRSVEFANPPTITLTSPLEGQWVHGQLDIAGSSTSEVATTTTITLGSVPLASSGASAWSTRYSLAGLPSATYTLTVRATDAQGLSTTVQRSIVVVSDPAMVQTPLFTMGASGRLLSAQGGELLWQAADGSVNRRKASGDTVTLQGAADLRYANDWQLDQGHVVAYGQADDCTAPLSVCVYAWDTSGQRRNLSSLVSAIRSYDQHPVLHYPWVMWINQSSKSTYTLQHLQPLSGQTAQYTITQPTEVTGTLGNWQYDFAVAPASTAQGNDELSAFFWGTQTGADIPSVGPSAHVYRWSTANATSQRLTEEGFTQVYVQTDGQRIAWQKRSPGSTDAPYEMRVAPASGSPVTTLSTEMTRFLLNDGLVAWHESSADGASGQRLQVHDGTQMHTLSTDRTASLLAAAGGAVVWSENGKLYAWRASSGKRRLADVVTGSVMSDGTWVYMTSGAELAVYQVALNTK